MAKSNNKRYRDFATVVYPESAPDNWIQILRDTHLQFFISPLHDKDVNPNGEPKKPHYHVMVMYDSCRYLENAQELFSTIGGVGCEIVKTKRGYARYLVHKDNPEKYQYSDTDVVCLGGADYQECVKNGADKFLMIDEIIQYIDEYKIEDIIELYRLALSEAHMNDWRRVVQENVYLLDKFCAANYKRRVYGKGVEHVQKIAIVDNVKVDI